MLGAGWVAGCNGLRTIDSLTPAGHYLLERDVAYGPAPRQRLDVYHPRGEAPAGARPIVVFFYGGSWRRGEKESYRFVGEYLSRLGFVAVVADYRLYPAVTFPAFVEDGATAVAWAIREAGRLGGDPRRVFPMGHSAGAHIAVLLALEPRYLAAQGLAPERLAGVIGISGPYDTDLSSVRWLRAVFAGEGIGEEARVLSKARAGAPPMLLANGGRDPLVNARHAVELATRLRALGNRVDLRIYEEAGHGDILLGLSTTLAGNLTLGGDVLAFVAPEWSVAG
ncbi:MAG: alpha/beta hydrolase [Alphaproteobacteria bacterium]|nr:alpha/beta hydrolase [Alphaproteobacteria bacterium]